jgi:hypothetical protein
VMGRKLIRKGWAYSLLLAFTTIDDIHTFWGGDLYQITR